MTRTAEPETGIRLAAEEPVAQDEDPAAGAEVPELEARLAARARESKQQQAELARTRALLRDAVERFDASVTSGVDQGAAQLRRERDHAVARALEAEAARADFRFRLDEVMGHLAAAGAAEGALPGERLDVTCARLTGTVRGLLSALAETQEGREVSQARLLLAEGDLQDVQAAARAVERELAEAREQLEFEALKAQRLSERFRGGLEQREASALRGERDGCRARGDEAERAFVAASASLSAARDELRRAREELADAGLARDALTSRIVELDHGVTRETQNRSELASELTRLRAERMAMSEELSRMRADLAAARSAAQGTDTERTRALQALADELDAARRAGEEPQARVERQSEALRKTREQLTEFAIAVRAVLDRASPAAQHAGAEAGDTHAGMPTYIEAVEGLEVELAANQERVRQLENRLAAAAVAARELVANPELSSAAAQLQALRALLDRG